jgi:Raf kinase inhibitor-like YbhB/YbcL family protein
MPTMRVLAIVSAFAALVLAGCGSGNNSSKPAPEPPNTMQLRSPTFKDGSTLPRKYTCDGSLGGVSPPLEWSKRPRDLNSQALVVTDPDAPGGTYVHWVLWGMMARTTGLQEDIPPIGLPAAKNSSGNTKYAPPCPPKGDPPHRYVFTIYALKQPLDAKNGTPASEAIDKIKRDALARGTLTGKYSR